MQYWLIKSEGDCYSIDDLKKEKRTVWTGIRNYQARNFMRDDMQIGDLALFYHSNGSTSSPSGVYGIAKVVSKPHTDETQFDKKDIHFDPKATKAKPIWQCVDFAFYSRFAHPVPLSQIKFDPGLKGIMVAKQGSRLSIMPVSEKHFRHIKKLATK